MTESPLAFSTRAVTGGRPPAEPDQPLNTPITPAATYIAGGDLEYGRYANPSWTAFEVVLGDLEGGTCVAFSSGLAAIAAVLAQLEPGAVVVAGDTYLGTAAQLAEAQRRGVLVHRPVDVRDTDAVAVAARGAAVVWLETPTNPLLDLADIPGVVEAAHAAGAMVVVDNTFATPLLQRPIEHGADVVVHAATKYLGGHSDLLMGAVVAADPQLAARITATRSLTGAVPSPFDAFLALRGIRTLPVRLERAQATAQHLVARLTGGPGLAEVRYPGFGAIVSIVLPDAERADALVAGCRLWRHATSLGGVESTLERRRRWAGESASVPPGLVRLSVGLEDPADLLADLQQALPG